MMLVSPGEQRRIFFEAVAVGDVVLGAALVVAESSL